MRKWKFNPGDQVVVNEKAPSHYRGCQATVIGHGPGRAQYAVNLGNQVVYLNSWWLDPVRGISQSQQE